MFSVFLSYASEDRDVARTIGEALSGFGLDVWFDQSELGGGDAWDRKIRKQIRDCDYFMPIVSARTEARHEGYFRREWRIAVERTLDMADDHLFLLPVVIDDTNEARARVPEKFLSVQWLKLPRGSSTPALEALCRRITSGAPVEPPANTPGAERPRMATPPSDSATAPPTAQPPAPPFPIARPDIPRLKHVADILGWALRSAWLAFRRLPRWIRIIVSVWLSYSVVTCNHDSARNRETTRKQETMHAQEPIHAQQPVHSPSVDTGKLAQILAQYRANPNIADAEKLGERLAREFGDEDDDSVPNALYAAPFSTPAKDKSARDFAGSAFAEIFGRLAISRHGHVGIDKTAAASSNEALEAARDSHAAYVLYGNVEERAEGRTLTVTLSKVSDGSIIWTKSYPTATANTAEIAAEVDAQVPKPDG